MKSKFFKIYKAIMLILLIAVVITWGVLWVFLKSYEEGRPNYFAENVVSWYSNKKVNNISKYVKLNSLNDLKSLKKVLSTQNKEISYTKDSLNYKDSKPVYLILSKGKKIASVTLKKKDIKGLFGINRWEIEEVNPILNLNTIKIYAPSSVNVVVNDNLLTKDNLIDENFYSEDLIIYKDYMDIEGIYAYEVKDMYDIRDVKVSEGNLIFEDNVYTYEYPKDDELLASLKEELSNWCINYTRYVLKENNFGSIAGSVVNGTETYSFLRGVANTNLWSGNHTPVEFKEMSFSNMQLFNDNAFKVDVKYKYSFNAEIGYQESDANLTLHMININGSWKIIKLTT